MALLEEALTVLFCRVDDIYYRLNPKGRCYETLKELSDSESITLALFQQLRGVESCRSFLREAARFFSHLFPGVVGLHPSSLHRRVRKLRRFFEPLRRAILDELVGDPETLIVDSTLLEVLHPRQVPQSAGLEGAAWVRWGSFSVYGVKLHLLCATNRVPISYELTPANVADLSLTEELLAEANLGGEVARKLLGDLAYRSRELEEELAESGIVLVSSEASARRIGGRQQIEIAISSLKRTFGLGETLATTLVGLATRIAAKITAYTYAFLINRMMDRPQGRIKELWA
ncbi:MAG: transposase [Acidobacteriaceae bacterium]|nr:transposase [Acidobacteriaceae bacterium]